MKEEIGLYLHFPFCVRKCGYCDFLSFPSGEDVRDRYALAMIREMESTARMLPDVRVATVFLGGGTPSIMPARMMRQIFHALFSSFEVDPEAEITMEMNPGTLSEEILSVVSDYVNRVSIGVQSFEDEELQRLGRIHNRRQALRSVELVRQAGIRNINLDLMSGIPGQTSASWKETLATALELQVPHISAYSLIIENGTPFAAMKREDLNLPDEDTEREMYHETKNALKRAGLARYEISNYARPGFACRHNIGYWRRKPYLGFGIGASSFYDHRRWKNTDSLSEYIQDSRNPALLVREPEKLTVKSEMEEFMFLGLRMTEGVTEEAFRREFHRDLREIYGPVLEKEISDGLMARDGARYFLTDRGVDISNWVLCDFLMD